MRVSEGWRIDLLRLSIAVGLAVAETCTVIGAEANELEHKVKAAFLFNFAANTEWPAARFASAESPIVIAARGHAPSIDLLERSVKNKKASGRTVLIKRLQPGDSIQGCHILYLAGLEGTQVAPMVAELRRESILSIGESEGFARSGGIINLVKVDGSVRFEVNPEAAAAAGVRLSSQVMKLAILVKENAPK